MIYLVECVEYEYLTFKYDTLDEYTFHYKKMMDSGWDGTGGFCKVGEKFYQDYKRKL